MEFIKEQNSPGPGAWDTVPCTKSLRFDPVGVHTGASPSVFLLLFLSKSINKTKQNPYSHMRIKKRVKYKTGANIVKNLHDLGLGSGFIDII